MGGCSGAPASAGASADCAEYVRRAGRPPAHLAGSALEAHVVIARRATWPLTRVEAAFHGCRRLEASFAVTRALHRMGVQTGLRGDSCSGWWRRWWVRCRTGSLARLFHRASAALWVHWWRARSTSSAARHTPRFGSASSSMLGSLVPLARGVCCGGGAVGGSVGVQALRARCLLNRREVAVVKLDLEKPPDGDRPRRHSTK